jgi:hypothetical protein
MMNRIKLPARLASTAAERMLDIEGYESQSASMNTEEKQHSIFRLLETIKRQFPPSTKPLPLA